LGAIYALNYATTNKRLHAGCDAHVAVWSFDIQGSIFKYEGERKIRTQHGPIVMFDVYEEALFYAQASGGIEGMKMNEKYEPCAKDTYVDKEV